MPSEIRSRSVKIEFVVSPGLKEKFRRHCKKEKVSMAQHCRDILQAELKKSR